MPEDKEIMNKCITMMDKKVSPLWDRKIDSKYFIPIVTVLFVLIGIVYTATTLNASQSDVDRIESELKTYSGMELRLVDRMDANRDKMMDHMRGMDK